MSRLPFLFAKSQGIVVAEAASPGARPLAWVRLGASIAALAEARRAISEPLQVAPVDAREFDRRLTEIYSHGDQTVAEVADDIGQDVDIARLIEDIPTVADLLDSEHEAPIIRMINALLTQAVREQASDIHIEPFEQHSVVRFRHDGMLRDVVSPHRALHAAMVSRIKIMASLDIAEKRLPQDGRVGIRLAGQAVDIRISTVPTNYGERVVLRLLHKSAEQLDLAALGMASDTLQRIDRMIRQPHGIVLVTGPTGSGKTTTLYAALSRLDTKLLNVMTVEDPVEYELSGIGQIQVNPRIDLSFAKALRSILRQDPDIIMIGEIRDLETAQIAVQASLTGHLVLATLHTNDTVSAVNRLVDMGMEPFLLASSLLGVLAQRLVRRLCPACREAYVPDAAELALFGAEPPAQLYRPVGCAACGRTGYHGRSGIYELLEIDEDLRRGIHEHAAEHVLGAIAQQQAAGFRLLREDGLRWVRCGETSLEELLRVTREQ
jgi:general secretion pathway protein E